MQNPFTLIGSAWDFYRTHPVLNHVLLWFSILPLSILFMTDRFMEAHPMFQGDELSSQAMGIMLFVALIQIILSVIIIWGAAGILTVGKRLLQSKAGRARTSLKQVMQPSKRFIVSLFFTDILRDCIAILFLVLCMLPVVIIAMLLPDTVNLVEGFPETAPHPAAFGFFALVLLLIIPTIIYYTRTVFYHVIIVCEGKVAYRKALRKSSDVVKGHTRSIFLTLLGVALVVGIPSGVLVVLFELMAEMDPRLGYALDILSSTTVSIVSILFHIALILLYKETKSLTTPDSSLFHVWRS